MYSDMKKGTSQSEVTSNKQTNKKKKIKPVALAIGWSEGIRH